MRKTKVFAIVYVTVLCMVLSACGQNRDTVREPSQTAQVVQTASTPAPSPTPTPSPTPKPTPVPLAQPELTTSFIDESLFEPCGKKGNVISAEYVTKNYYSSSDEEVIKHMSVYLPWGYDESENYDVLFVMHVMTCDENFWLNSYHEYETREGESMTVLVPDLLDNMIDRGMCPPVIVVSPCGYITQDARYERNSERDFYQFKIELEQDILPYIEEHFSVFQGRDHYGFYGASFGAYMEYRSVLGPNFDRFSWFSLTGGGYVDPDWLKAQWAQEGFGDLPMNCLILTEGEYDDRGPVEMGYYALNPNFENVYYNMIEKTGHNTNEWVNAMYNALQLFFRD